MFNLRQLRLNQAGDWSLMVKSLIGETLAICLVEDDVVFFFFLRSGRWWVEREIYIWSGLYGGDRGGIYFIFFSILKLIEIIFKLLDKYKKNMMEMTWLLTWLNMSVTTLNTMFQLLVLYRLKLYSLFSIYRMQT